MRAVRNAILTLCALACAAAVVAAWLPGRPAPDEDDARALAAGALGSAGLRAIQVDPVVELGSFEPEAGSPVPTWVVTATIEVIGPAAVNRATSTTATTSTTSTPATGAEAPSPSAPTTTVPAAPARATVRLDIDRDRGGVLAIDDRLDDRNVLTETQVRVIGDYDDYPSIDERLERNAAATAAGLLAIGAATCIILFAPVRER